LASPLAAFVTACAARVGKLAHIAWQLAPARSVPEGPTGLSTEIVDNAKLLGRPEKDEARGEGRASGRTAVTAHRAEVTLGRDCQPSVAVAGAAVQSWVRPLRRGALLGLPCAVRRSRCCGQRRSSKPQSKKPPRGWLLHPSRFTTGKILVAPHGCGTPHPGIPI